MAIFMQDDERESRQVKELVFIVQGVLDIKYHRTYAKLELFEAKKE